MSQVQEQTPEKEKTAIAIRITPGNINHGNFYLSRSIDFFPADAVGANNGRRGKGKRLTLHISGFEKEIVTDIEGRGRFFRRQGWVSEFFRIHEAEVDDYIIVKRLDNEYTYSVRLLKYDELIERLTTD